MKIILMGPPGSGKGTQAKLLSAKLNLPHIATGDLMRNIMKSDSELGQAIRAYVDAGQLVPDEQVVQLLWQRLQEADCKAGYILDGFPRTLSQAKALEAASITLDAIIEISVSDDVIVERVSGRLVDPASGRVYHTLYNPPKEAGRDDITGEALIQRSDDQAPTVRARLAIYARENKLILDYYQQLAKVDSRFKVMVVSGQVGVEQVQASIIDKLHSLALV